MSTGRLLVDAKGFSVYASDLDAPGKSNCDAACAETWIPILAPALARPNGEWSLVERSSGIRQWAFQGRPLYTYRLDGDTHRQKGSDVPGWHNVYLQRAPDPPAGFTVQDTTAGQVLADAQGKTIYTYFCGDDALDQLGCDHPTETQAYRLAICGGGDGERCMRSYPYVPAPRGVKSTSRSWSVIYIDPLTGRFADPKQPGALRVWAYRDRPVYTFAGDREPGDAFADGHGEFRGQRNGFKAFWLRDDFFGADQPGPG
jgi:predicted lipoprotein with Yx(FWY)xxD motif